MKRLDQGPATKNQEPKKGKFHLLGTPLGNTLLADLRSDDCDNMRFRQVSRTLYELLLHEIVDFHFPRDERFLTTNLGEDHTVDNVIVPDSPVSLLVIARAGMGVSDHAYDVLNHLFPNIQITTHVVTCKRVNDEHGSVIGAKVTGAKIYGRVEGHTIMVLDPMLATGHSLLAGLHELAEYGLADAKRIISAHHIAVKEGITHVHTAYPSMQIHAVALDPILDEKCYIRPGYGDAGDLYYRGINS